jgi:tryptophan-rich sensory protein
MKNNSIAHCIIGSLVVYVIASMVYATSSDEGVLLLFSLLAFAAYSFFAIWGLVRLFKSKE